ncbi:hypothetical protein GLOIN_2v415082 [Rhizophagus clarus]|uniref:Uncharacterized protein n=1 Tax=Rhizophagus clarus TaxID=94130 RepID=A0A8H3MAV7_9GLOM|nr:hypothetical protein GLOIN_2v415082 [Rhizophagus clarus]
MQNCRINDLISVQTDDQRFINSFKLIEPQKITGSLVAYNDLESETLLQFKQIFCCELEDTITVYGEGMNVEFSSISNLIDKSLQNDSYIVVQLIINQCKRIQIAAEIFRSALTF